MNPGRDKHPSKSNCIIIIINIIIIIIITIIITVIITIIIIIIIIIFALRGTVGPCVFKKGLFFGGGALAGVLSFWSKYLDIL